MVTTVRNSYRVPLSQWRKWKRGNAQRVFNDIYWLGINSQELITHPKTPKIKPFEWKTIAWNAAWLAADAVRDQAKAAIRIRGGKAT